MGRGPASLGGPRVGVTAGGCRVQLPLRALHPRRDLPTDSVRAVGSSFAKDPVGLGKEGLALPFSEINTAHFCERC